MSLFYLSIEVLLNITANFCFKYSSLEVNRKSLSIIFFVSGLIFGGINTIFFTQSLKKIDLNIAYPVFSAGSIILISILTLFLFHESLTIQKAAGIVVICIGIGLITA
jgi:multidrug transporter EmrE-like cation transporter